MLNDEGNFDSYDKSIRTMCVSSYSDRLWIGTETWQCAKIVSYYKSPSGQTTWTKIEMDGDDCTLSVSGCLDLGDGKMLFGTWAQFGYNVYMLDEKNDDKLTKLNTPQCTFNIGEVVTKEQAIRILTLRSFFLPNSLVPHLLRSYGAKSLQGPALCWNPQFCKRFCVGEDWEAR